MLYDFTTGKKKIVFKRKNEFHLNEKRSGQNGGGGHRFLAGCTQEFSGVLLRVCFERKVSQNFYLGPSLCCV